MAEICLERATLSTQASQETADAIALYEQQPHMQIVRSDRKDVQGLCTELIELVNGRPNNYKNTSFSTTDPIDPSGVEPLAHFVAVSPVESMTAQIESTD